MLTPAPDNQPNARDSRIPIIGETPAPGEADPKLVAAQKEMVEGIKAQAAEQAADREAAELVKKLVPPSASELEKQREFAVALDKMTMKRLQEGAVALEKMVCQELRQGPAGDIAKAHAMMEQAKALRIAMQFIEQG